MMSVLQKYIDILSSSYWFIPSLMAIGALFSAIVMTQSTWVLGLDVVDYIGWIRSTEPEGARTVMATIAGSMITVAGVTFSITISSIVHATTQFGPRLLTNFMQDRGNQFTLGTFIATFLYCLLVLSSITGDSAIAGGEGNTVFVPLMAVVLGVGYAIASIVVLIFFVHHVPASIHASHVISSVGKQLLEKIELLYPIDLTSENHETRPLADVDVLPDQEKLQQFRSTFTGYIQFLDTETILRIAQELDTIIVLNVKPGDFVSKGDYLAWANVQGPIAEEVVEQLCQSFLYGDRRTPAQDILFLANELVEIATRALSPGINDPFTAMMCMDWLGSSFAAIANRRSLGARMYDIENRLRIDLSVVEPREYIFATLSKLMPYAARDRNAAIHLQATIGKLMINSCRDELLSEFLLFTREIGARAKVNLDATDVELLVQRQDVLEKISTDHERNVEIYMSNPWLYRGT